MSRKPALHTDTDSYLQRILRARVYEVAKETAVDPAPRLSKRLGNKVLLKREDQQPVFSFKLRGAYNKMAQLTPEQLQRGVICASAGNHAQGVALGARKLGCRAVIVMPVTTPRLKIEAVAQLGGEVLLHGDSYSDAFVHAQALQAEQQLVFVHPFDDPDVIAGQGTVGLELLRQHPGPLDAVFVAVGGGGPDLRRGGLHQGHPAGRQGDRRADAGLQRHAHFGARGAARDAAGRRSVQRRHGRQAGRRGDLSHRP
jgi:threonine dehydratase